MKMEIYSINSWYPLWFLAINFLSKPHNIIILFHCLRHRRRRPTFLVLKPSAYNSGSNCFKFGREVPLSFFSATFDFGHLDPIFKVTRSHLSFYHRQRCMRLTVQTTCTICLKVGLKVVVAQLWRTRGNLDLNSKVTNPLLVTLFLAHPAEGPMNYCHGAVSVVRPSVRRPSTIRENRYFS